MRRLPPFLVLVYLGIGAWIAWHRHYFENVHGARGVAAAVIVVVLWPLLVLDLIVVKRT